MNIKISYGANFHIIEKEKLNKLSFGYYEFISAVNSIRETNLFREASPNGEKKKLVFFLWIFTRFKRKNIYVQICEYIYIYIYIYI